MRSYSSSTATAALLLFGAPIVTGAAGALATVRAPAFYQALVKPSWAPPPSLFGPVWTALYLLMGIAAFLVWRRHGWNGALVLFLVQLVPNALWSWLFFRWQLGAASIADIALLWVMIVVLEVWFSRLRVLSAVLLLPYLAWVTFATALNIAIVRATPSL